ncbi:DUF448 domain-containing protein [bacterium]|nr:MAG: DUF448 domain-containing protein [bacterium]
MPIRTCVACRQRFEQRELVRVTRFQSGDGLALVAVPGRPLVQPSGRSAYFCSGCRDRVKPASLARTLRGPVSPDALAHALTALPNPH